MTDELHTKDGEDNMDRRTYTGREVQAMMEKLKTESRLQYLEDRFIEHMSKEEAQRDSTEKILNDIKDTQKEMANNISEQKDIISAQKENILSEADKRYMTKKDGTIMWLKITAPIAGVIILATIFQYVYVILNIIDKLKTLTPTK